MRLLAFTAPCLTALLFAGTAAGAEPVTGWVDPPAKADVGISGDAAPKPAEPANAEAKMATPALRFETTDRHHSRSRRLAVSSGIDTTAPDSRLSGLAGRAQRLTGGYLDSVSAPNATMLASAPSFYGERVRFHGRSMSIAALIAEKRRFVQRWPERHYAPKDGTMRTACDTAGATCTVRTVMGFSAESPERGARSEGLSELILTVSFVGGRPVIISESSRVLQRRSAALSSAERGRDDGA